MNLIDRYVAEVGRHLPEKSRADIEKEIRSTLEDMLEDRSQKAGRPVDEAMAVEVLKEFGSPGKVAASYLPERYLIGPHLYPHFLRVMKISLLIAFVAAMINLSVGIIRAEPSIATVVQSIVEAMLSMAGTFIAVLGNIVLVFAVMERVLPHVDFKDAPKQEPAEWDPRSLPETSSAEERVNTSSLISEIVFTIGALLIFNFYPQILGIGFMADGKWVFIPVLAGVFFQYLPWMNIHWGLEISQDIMLLQQGHWQPFTRWFSLFVDLFGIGILYAILQGPSIVGLTPDNLRSLGIADASSAQGLVNLVHAGVTLGLVVAVIVQTIHTVIKLHKLLSRDAKRILPEIE